MNKDTARTPLDYSDNKVTVYFEIGGVKIPEIREMIENIDFESDIKYLEYGFEVLIPIQRIPEVARDLVKSNIAIYAIKYK